MKYVLSILIFIHGSIHILGFVKAFKFAEVNELSQDISRAHGILWLIAALLLLTTLVLRLSGIDTWWVFSL